MKEKQWELLGLLEQMEHLFVNHQAGRLNNINEESRQLLATIKALIDGGVDLTIKPKGVLERAVVTNSVELVEMFIAAGQPITEENGKMLLYYATEKGAEQVVRFLIEEKGVDARRKSPRDYSVLAAARASRVSSEVLPYLLEVMLKTKSERQPAPKKLHELTEENMLKCLPQVTVSEQNRKKLNAIIESLFIEEHSLKLDDFYRMISTQDPEIIFACIGLIKNAITSAPKDKVVKDVSGQTNVHHGNLEITSDLNIQSLMVTGDLIIAGQVTNYHGGQLFVGGNFQCESLYSIGPVIIGGNLKATKVQGQVIAGSFDVKEQIEKTEEDNEWN